jgi:PAS domain S-box-containing protein
MSRRSKAGGEPAKTRRRKTVAQKRRSLPKAVRPRSSSASGQENMIARLTREAEAREAEQQLPHSSAQFAILVQSIKNHAIYMMDKMGRITSWNSGAERIKGYTRDEIIGQHFSRFFTDFDRKSGLPTKALRQASLNGKFEGEGWRVRKDGSQFWASVMIYPIHGDSGTLIGFAKVTRDETERRQAQDLLDWQAAARTKQ